MRSAWTGALCVIVVALSCIPLPVAAQSRDAVVAVAGAAGGLSISNPAAVNLSSTAAPGAALTGQLGVVTVTDARGPGLFGWTATVSSSTFTTGGASAAETIGRSALTYYSGTATATSGVGLAVVLPGQTLGLAAPLSSPVTAFTLTGGGGANTVSWNPTLAVSIPPGAVAGTYTGTITHSVA